MNSQAPAVATAKRLLSLDVFRGATIALMILVNNPGNDRPFSQLSHAQWNGWTATDLVFPFFLFIVGVSLVLSTAGRVERGESKRTLVIHSVRRAVIIFALGLFLNGIPHIPLSTLRIPGVLQRIALCYLAASLLYIFTNVRVRWAIIAALLFGYWMLMRFVPVPGVGVPGVEVPMLDPDNNIVAWLDRKLMMGHLYESVRDPEGILSTFPAIANVLFGVAAGEWVRKFRGNSAALLRRLITTGLSCFVVAQLWAISFPINKKLWTSSYVLLTVGLAMLVLTFCYWLLDVHNSPAGWIKPFLVFGSNAIVAYVLAELIAIVGFSLRVAYGGVRTNVQNVIFAACFNWIEPPQVASLAFSVVFVLFCYVPVWMMYERKMFVRI